MRKFMVYGDMVLSWAKMSFQVQTIMEREAL